MIFILLLIGAALAEPNCPKFLSYYENAKAITSLSRGQNLILESRSGPPTLNVGYVNVSLSSEQEADAFTVAAQLSIRDGLPLNSFVENAACLNRAEVPLGSSRPKYQSLDGYGNNLNHPFWGSSETPFGRFGPKNYADGIQAIRKSDRTSQYLPSPREIVEKVLKKAKRSTRTSKVLNFMLPQFYVAMSHDIGHSAPVNPVDRTQRVNCCAAGNKNFLPRSARHSTCIPFAIPKDDSFYNASGTRCMSLVRSQLASSPSGVQFGEIRNKASSYLDLSFLYGANLEESNKIRSFSQGKILLTPGETLPVDSSGRFTAISARLNIVISVDTFAILFSRYHNKLAERLAALNPSWDDEKVFQEARRLNIALSQNIAISSSVVENTFGKYSVESYDEVIDSSETVEFQQAVVRFIHFAIPSFLRLVDIDGQVTEFPQSDLIGRVDVLDRFADDYVRGAMNQSIFNEAYSDELHNKFFKGAFGIPGVGVDVYSFDIQRGREQGHPTWLQARERCGLPANFTEFCDLNKILRKSTVDLLKATYDSVQDIDLYVGGALESFAVLDKRLYGETFSCIVRDQYRRMIAGDAYFFTHSNSPNPFTPAQLSAIKSSSVNQMICSTMEIESVNKQWHLVDSSSNPKVSCSQFPEIDLSAWKEA